MKTACIISEFNPFHNGHKFLIDSVRKEYDVDYVVVFMSGDFTQRGEPAIYDKYTRTSAALSGGADVVFELPVVYSTSAAPDFAYGGTYLADALSVVDYLAFGSECGDINSLCNAADILLNEPSPFKELIKSGQKVGKSYALAVSDAFKEYCGSDVLDGPNNTLGIEYIKSLKQLKSNICPVTIKRYGVSHNASNSIIDSNTGLIYESASSIRSRIMDSDERSDNPMFPDDFALPVFNTLKSMNVSDLSDILGADNDNASRILRASAFSSTLTELTEKASHKQNTRASVQRVLTHLLLDIHECDKTEPSYIRLLGMKKNASGFMKAAQKNSSIPIVTKAADFGIYDNALFMKDLTSADLYAHAKALKYKLPFKPDVAMSPIII